MMIVYFLVSHGAPYTGLATRCPLVDSIRGNATPARE